LGGGMGGDPGKVVCHMGKKLSENPKRFP